jgi:cyclopropane-fatty-acyl-phospholipid synthase
MANKAKELITELLALADVKINGSNPWDPQIHDERFYHRLLKDRELGLGESYVAGWWDCQHIDQLIDRVLRAKLPEQVKLNKKMVFRLLRYVIFNHQSKSRAFDVGEKHYDIGNSLYEKMLDPEMSYSCAYWENAHDLERAQFNKLDLICKKLQLKPGMRLLDIGCGWGGMARHAAKHYGAEVIGITISKEQAKLAQDRNQGLPIDIRVQDYRDLNETFDAIVSIGMFEHVGPKNYKTYFSVANRCLKDKGLFLLHTIGDNISTTTANPWITKYIFPNGVIPSIGQIGKAMENKFMLEDLHSFGAYYDLTLMAWHQNFTKHWPEIHSTQYDDQFKRMWDFYLLSCAGAFRARYLQLWQFVLSKNGVDGVYKSVR